MSDAFDKCSKCHGMGSRIRRGVRVICSHCDGAGWFKKAGA